MIPAGVQQPKSGRCGAVECPGRGQPDPPFADPGQRADSGGEAGLRVLWGGEERRMADAHRESGETE